MEALGNLYDAVLVCIQHKELCTLVALRSLHWRHNDTIVYSDVDQRKHQSSASLAFVWGIHRDRWTSRAKGQLRGKCFHLMTSSWLCFLFRTILPMSFTVISLKRHPEYQWCNIDEHIETYTTRTYFGLIIPPQNKAKLHWVIFWDKL